MKKKQTTTKDAALIKLIRKLIGVTVLTTKLLVMQELSILKMELRLRKLERAKK